MEIPTVNCSTLRSLVAQLTLVGLAYAPAAALAQNPAKPVAVVAISGYDELMKDVDFLGSLAGQPQASQNIDVMLQMFTQQKGLEGLDKTLPLGAVVTHDGVMPGGAVLAPVTDLAKLLDVLKGLGVTSQPGDGGVTQISAQGQTAFAKTMGKWAAVSMAPAMLDNLPADVGEMLASLTKDYDLAVKVFVQNVPEAYRQQGIELISMSARQGLQKQDGETDDAYAERQKQVEAQLEQMKRAFNELDQFTVGLALDSAQHRAYLDFGYQAIPGTKLAQDIAAQNDSKTNFAGFFQPDAAMTMSFASKVTGADEAQLTQMMATLRQKAAAGIDESGDVKSEQAKSDLKAGINEFLDAVEATLKNGVMDGGAVLNMTPEALTFVAGGYIAEPAKVESGLKKIISAAKSEDDEGKMPEVKWSSDSHAGVTFHTLSAPIPADEEEARQFFGEAVDMAVGIGKNSVYFALGRDCLDAVKKVIDVSAKSPNKPIAPMEMTLALGQIMDVAQSMAKGDDKAKVEMIANMLKNETSGRDHVRIVTQPIENGVRVRIETEEGVLRAIGMAAMAAQMQGAGAP
jgi:hypothetical protein